MKSLLKKASVCILLISFFFPAKAFSNDINSGKPYVIDEQESYLINTGTWETMPAGGDTIFISSSRTSAIKFQNIVGAENAPIVVINSGGQVQIDSPAAWGAITFENCKYIKISGTGHPGFKYGFTLSAETCGLAFSELSSDCETEFIKISHEGFFGIMAKKDYGGNPPSPAPVFSNLVIHDCFIENVSEGMYLGETKSPGMEFKHVRVYNNIVRNTKRECIQIANMVEDVEIYNNTLLNAGNSEIAYQGSLFQVGDNTVSKVYNNIMIGATTYGIATFGMGNNYFSNNYIGSCKGVFIDNRLFSLQDSIIEFSNNYFTNSSNSENEIIRNLNGENFLLIENNIYDDSTALFYRNYFESYTNFRLENNVTDEIIPITFADPQENDYSLTADNPQEYMSMGAPGGAEYMEYEVEPLDSSKIPQQIILTSDMIVDLVDGGSVYSAQYLIDEQNCTPENELHPESKSWKPFWNMNYGPYTVYIDLKKNFHVSNIALHDMHNVKNLDVYTGEPGNWELLFTEPCNNYKTWKSHKTDISTQYICLTMNESVYAAVNEIVIYGYADTDSVQHEKNARIAKSSVAALSEKEALLDDLQIYPNPVQDKLTIDIPFDLASDYKIEIINMYGNICYQQIYRDDFHFQPTINLNKNNIQSGIYFMRYTNSSGASKIVKFIKNNS